MKLVVTGVQLDGTKKVPFSEEVDGQPFFCTKFYQRLTRVDSCKLDGIELLTKPLVLKLGYPLAVYLDYDEAPFVVHYE